MINKLLPLRPCRRCGKAHINRNGYCADHQELAIGWAKRQKGKTTTQRGYGHAWRVLRSFILKRDKYCCVLCAGMGIVKAAHAVDHIVPKEQGGTDDEDNLQSICFDHHKAKTQSEALAGRNISKG